MPARKARTTPLFRERRSQSMMLSSGEADVKVHESRQAKRLTLRVKPGDDGEPIVSLSVPPRTTERQILDMLTRNRGWVERAIAEQQTSSSKLGLRRHGHVPFEATLLRVVRARRDGRPRVEWGHTPAGELVVGLFGPGEKLPVALERWLRESTRRRGEEVVSAAPATLGGGVTKVRVGDQRTRWGSMTTKGVMSLNWRLILAPPQVLEYVVLHEMCHLLEMNHSPRFWAHVARHCPEWEARRRWLREHGDELRAWSPTGALSGPDADLGRGARRQWSSLVTVAPFRGLDAAPVRE